MNMVRIGSAAARMVWRGGARMAGGAAAAGALGAAFGSFETQRFRLRRREFVLDGAGGALGGSADAAAQAPNDSACLRILHLSDIHLLARQSRKREWISSLAEYEPQLIVLTGDLIAEAAALDSLMGMLAPFASLPGLYVFGSNDYVAPQFKNPLSYLGIGPMQSPEAEAARNELPWRELDAALAEAGWLNLTNTRAELEAGGMLIDAVGVDDAHIDRDRFPAPAPGREGAMRIGVAHAPYMRVLDAMAEEGCDVVFAGHTHGGQVCVPGLGALVTNCDLPRTYASGFFAWPLTGAEPIRGDGSAHASERYAACAPTVAERRFAPAEAQRKAVGRFQPSPGAHRAWVNVSAGLGASPFAPVRVACPPEAIILDVRRGA